ncbi:MAG: DEAD/DEAH box helicase [Cyanobacteria bacterium J06634_6]
MRKIDCGMSGSGTVGSENNSANNSVQNWASLKLAQPWPEVIALLGAGSSPRSVQALALNDYAILENRKNLIVSAPTNSGKSLIGWLTLFQVLREGKRAVLLEPLRALAREKGDELERIAKPLGKLLGRPIQVKISTGDYRIEDELMGDPPPGGELIVATPERLEALLRKPGNLNWFESIGAVCVDEAHLLASDRRGPTLEYLLTTFLAMASPPRLLLLSATLGNTEALERWLSPCEVVKVTERQPPLEKWVFALEAGEEANQVAIAATSDILKDPEAQLLIFVYQTRSAQSLATQLSKALNVDGRAYHAQMSQQQRAKVRQSFLDGDCRVMVTTTALALGMNLPASHVLVRDSTFPKVGRLEVSQLLQMMGRAGRGNQAGVAAVMVRPNDGWDVEALTEALRTEALPELSSTFDRKRWAQAQVPLGTNQVAALLSRHQTDGITQEKLKSFFEHSLGGRSLVSQVPVALRWLESQTLAYQDAQTQTYRLTVLGQRATRAVLPMPVAAGYAQLLRDLMTVDPSDQLLAEWTPLDHLLVLDLLSERSPNLRRYSVKLAQQVDAWCERSPEQVPLLFKKWMRGDEAHSQTAEILGSLGIEGQGEGWAHRQGYVAMFRGMVLGMRSQGVTHTTIERQYGMKGLVGIEERWRDELLWLLSGVSKLLEIRTFYYHLREDCEADFKRVKRVKQRLRQLRFQVYALQEQLKYCSPLGNVLGDIRRLVPRGLPKVGVQTIRRLEDSGVTSLKALAALEVDDLVQVGVRRQLADQIKAYLMKRRRV